MKAEIFLGGFLSMAVVATLSLAPAAAAAAGSGQAGKNPPVTLENIPGSTVRRVTLTAKAAERLGIETGKVSEEPIVRKQMVGGLTILPMETQPEPKLPGGSFGNYGQVAPASAPKSASSRFGGLGRIAAAPPPKSAGGGFGGFGLAVAAASPPKAASGGFGGFAQATDAPASQPVAAPATAPAGGEAWVLVTLSQGEWDRLAKDKPARVLPLATRDKPGDEVLARPSGMPPREDSKRSMLTAYYVLPGNDHGLALNQRMRVELQLSGSDEKHKTVPYAAVYYDAKGIVWVYVNTRPLVFERQRITVERVVGDLAVLSDGPPLGTPVVTVGAALLYGAEIFGK